MKAIIAAIFLCTCLLLSNTTLACGSSCYNYGSACGGCSNNSCDSDSCGNQTSCGGCSTAGWDNQFAYGNERSCDCMCTDNGWRYNDCISKCEFCAAFGNIGAR